MRHDQTTRPMSQSPMAGARLAMEIGQAALPRHGSEYSPHIYTLPQWFACLVLRQFFQNRLPRSADLLKDLPELCSMLKLEKVPHYSTLCYAQQRLLRADPFHALQRQVWQAAQRLGLVLSHPRGRVDATGLETHPRSVATTCGGLAIAIFVVDAGPN